MPRFGITTIRARLLVGFVLMALLPAVAVSAGSIAVGYVNGREQALDRLESVAALKEGEIGAWKQAFQNELAVALNEEYALDRARVVLDLAQSEKYVDFYNKAMRNRLQLYVAQTPQLKDLFLLDLQGQVTLSTDVTQEGQDHSTRTYFRRGVLEPFVELPFDPDRDRSTAFAAMPIMGIDGRLLGVMAGRADVRGLDDILRERTGLGDTGKSYLVDANYTVLEAGFGDSGLGEPSVERFGIQEAHSLGIDAAIQSQANGSAEYDDYRGVRVAGVYRWLPELRAALLTEQDQAEAFGAITTTLGVNVSIALVAVLLAAGAALLITRSIAAPLINLVETTAQIASGDLERVAKVAREDEVGALARAFNSMTAQLRDLINSLEERVAERTQTLQRRALQLETSAQVSRELSSILDIDTLLAQVVQLIREAFGYSYVHIFLVDKDAQQLILRASSGGTDSQLERLEIGPGSLNSQVAQSNQALLVNDVTQEPRYLADELLPGTRSELVIPLRIGERVTGTLDVHSAQLDAFAPQDALVLQSLGDQIAIAIENARLYRRSRALAVLEERNRLARELHDSVTQSLYGLVVFAGAGQQVLESGGTDLAKGHLARMEQAAQQALKEMRLLVYELRPPALEQVGLVGALQQRLDAVESRAGIETHLLAEVVVELPEPVQGGLFGIALEALNNVLKHAAASSVTVQIRASDEGVELTVADDGVGFDAAGDTGGLGLTSMRERAQELGASLTIHSAPGEGTRVSVRKAK